MCRIIILLSFFVNGLYVRCSLDTFILQRKKSFFWNQYFSQTVFFIINKKIGSQVTTQIFDCIKLKYPILSNFKQSFILRSIMQTKKQQTIKLRGTVLIYYASMTGSSKIVATKFQQQLQKEQFIAPIINIGDLTQQQFLQTQGSAIFFLSTFGSGGPTQDAQCFFNWISNVQKDNQLLKNMHFMIFALGNRTFEHFCGHGKKIRECFINLGAKQINQICFSDASSEEQQYLQVYQKWYKNAVELLKQRYQLKQVPKNQALSTYDVRLKNGSLQNWQQLALASKNVGIQCLSFLKAFKAQVIHVKQLRKITNKLRSTLWIRIKKPKQLILTPACNINVYPQNVLSEQQQARNQIIELILPQKSKIKKLPFADMPYKQFLKIANFSQNATQNFLKTGLLVSEASQQIKKKYQDMLKDKVFNVSAGEVIRDLQLGIYQETHLGVNRARPYTLSSWSQEYIDLLVSLAPNGLTSQYFKTVPKFIRVKPTDSSFHTPRDSPIVMIANGSGMAPFRSIAQYVAALPKEKRIALTLFYGCQNKDDDFYFDQQWKSYEEEGIVKVFLAESTRIPDKKVYVQDIIGQNLQLLRKHLFDDNGWIYICGGLQMAKSVKQKIFQACKLKEKIPFKAYKLNNKLIQQKRIIEEVFH